MLPSSALPKHMPALPYGEAAAFMAALRERSLAARALSSRS